MHDAPQSNSPTACNIDRQKQKYESITKQFKSPKIATENSKLYRLDQNSNYEDRTSNLATIILDEWIWSFESDLESFCLPKSSTQISYIEFHFVSENWKLWATQLEIENWGTYCLIKVSIFSDLSSIFLIMDSAFSASTDSSFFDILLRPPPLAPVLPLGYGDLGIWCIYSFRSIDDGWFILFSLFWLNSKSSCNYLINGFMIILRSKRNALILHI